MSRLKSIAGWGSSALETEDAIQWDAVTKTSNASQFLAVTCDRGGKEKCVIISNRRAGRIEEVNAQHSSVSNTTILYSQAQAMQKNFAKKSDATLLSRSRTGIATA